MTTYDDLRQLRRDLATVNAEHAQTFAAMQAAHERIVDRLDSCIARLDLLLESMEAAERTNSTK
ncbi:hypothetical protein AWB80_02909 [Caballeronia pedi]|uniref:Uncharacterized protein n=1 Tax=Caballeronia pedi TaxID=1777141 RepID=A0A158B0Z3_9BURK|nr:hypothetical protein AWB80_02909 [Caballeronia pedi]